MKKIKPKKEEEGILITKHEEIVKQQVYIRPLDLDDAKECWKIAKKAIDKMVSLAVEQEKERILSIIKKEYGLDEDDLRSIRSKFNQQ